MKLKQYINECIIPKSHFKVCQQNSKGIKYENMWSDIIYDLIIPYNESNVCYMIIDTLWYGKKVFMISKVRYNIKQRKLYFREVCSVYGIGYLSRLKNKLTKNMYDLLQRRIFELM